MTNPDWPSHLSGHTIRTAKATLTKRELEVFRLLEIGLGHRRVAECCEISPTTVRDTYKRALRKIRQAKENAA